MGRPMFRDSRLKLGSKYSSGEMAVGLVGLAACCTGAWVGPGTWLSAQDGACRAPPSGPRPLTPGPGSPRCERSAAGPSRGRTGTESFPLRRRVGAMRGLRATAPRMPPSTLGASCRVGDRADSNEVASQLVPDTLARPDQGDPTTWRYWAGGRRTWVYLCSSTCPDQTGALCGCVSPAPRWWHCIPGEQEGYEGSWGLRACSPHSASPAQDPSPPVPGNG